VIGGLVIGGYSVAFGGSLAQAQTDVSLPESQGLDPGALDVMDLDPTDSLAEPANPLPASLEEPLFNQTLENETLMEEEHTEGSADPDSETVRSEDSSRDSSPEHAGETNAEESSGPVERPSASPVEAEPGSVDDELGTLRIRPQNSTADPDLGVLRIQAIEELPLEEPPPEAPIRNTGFITAQTSYFGGTNLFRAPIPLDERVFQGGAGLFLFPKVSPTTHLLAGVEGNLVRYSNFPGVSYNELQFQLGVRQRLSERVYGQLSWRNQKLYTLAGNSFFEADYAELLLSRRDILNSRLWLDSYYQMRFSFSDPDTFSRFSQVLIAALNYGFTPQLRTSLIYQLFLDDYTTIERYDTYHQVIGQLSYDLSPSSRVNLFGGAKFGRSSATSVNFDDLIYGVSVSVNLPVF
jgi:hypothetical protein